ncbi:MAG: hypothetical protein H0T89_04415 [Deltaproteobacteria bacterium]|nr:hypothetical protein [Deltaproteobacteria bacterium]MDQ3301368.1 hypothetical protein [Myxococcota bacterium]
MKAALGIVFGAGCALLIACGAGAQKVSRSPATSPGAAEPTSVSGQPSEAPRFEIDELDRQIDADLAKLRLARPPAPADSCVSPPCDPQRMSTAAGAANAPPEASCKPGRSDVCTDSCTLKDSICKSAGRICEIASQLGGNDSYANEKCASSSASCSAAKERCCACM